MIRPGAVAGVAEGAYIFAMPGSPGAYEDAKFPSTCRAPATSLQLFAWMPQLKVYLKELPVIVPVTSCDGGYTSGEA